MLRGSRWQGRLVVAHCDNLAVVEVINAGYSKDPQLMQLLCCLYFVLAHHELSLRATHILGRLNVGADAISRDNLTLLFSQDPRQASSPQWYTGLWWTWWFGSSQTGYLQIGSNFQDLFAAGIVPSTRKVNGTGASRYLNFCSMAKLPPYPAEENTLMLLVARLYNGGLAPGTMKSYLAGVRCMSK